MKKILIPLVLLIIVGACKKDGSGGGNNKLLLHKVYYNDLLYREFIYSGDGRLIRFNQFLTGGGQSTLSTYAIYEYNADGTIKEEFHYNKDHIAITKRLYSYNTLGKVSRIDEAVDYSGNSDFEDFDYEYWYDYDNKGQLTKIISRETDFTIRWHENFTYDEKGNLDYDELRYFENNQMVLKQKTEIVPGTGKIPEHWQIFLLQPTDFNFHEMYITSMKYTSYWILPASTTDYTFKSRVYNNQGYLTSQTYETVSKSGTFTNDYTYEYVQQ